MIWFIATARRTLVCFSSALGSRRSAKTLPELRATVCFLLFLLAMPRLVVLLSQSEPLGYQLHISSRCLDSAIIPVLGYSIKLRLPRYYSSSRGRILLAAPPNTCELLRKSVKKTL